ncbi:hypothetical protein BVH03_22920 [Pseudomonas sp. PA15(2017)]|uniref:phage tail tube protein n=1 Tax=Pseudomonas sp. PA15(2017) TaxID=1932111 RepID=UPI00095AA156|nr:hypothetical protein [Pseudomonas sp. PA15(2017)]OLU23085.1 hypothetical protein BVH03_22920 [Pseudomonas sp. PA15(2017)]
MTQIDRSFVGEGIIYARKYQSQDPLIDIGNCDTFTLAYTVNRVTLPNYRGGGGNRNGRSPVTDVQATIGMYDITAENLARVTRSTLSAVLTTAIVDQPLVSGGVEGELIPFKYLPDLSKTVAVKGADDGVLDPGTDYLLTPHGIIVTGSGKITAAGIKASYTPLAQAAVQMLNGSEGEFELYIAGLNDAQSGEPFSLRPRRIKFGTIAQLPILGTEYLKLEAPAELLADPLVLSNDISKFCEMQIVDKVA